MNFGESDLRERARIVLGVGADVDGEELKRAYRSLAKKYHPDRNPDSNTGEEFQLVIESYMILSGDRSVDGATVLQKDEAFENFTGQGTLFDRHISRFYGSDGTIWSDPPETGKNVDEYA